MITGRAGRVRLQRRLAVARHGADLLDRKRRILADEADRLDLLADRTRRVWQAAAAEAADWATRALALDGPAALRAAAPVARAEVEVDERVATGVLFPVDTRFRCDPPREVGGSSALDLAAAAHRDALDAAVAHAAARRAVALVRAELDTTRIRQRAVERRWVPRLERELAELERAIAELEMAEGLRLRWAAGRVGVRAAAPGRGR